MLPEQGRCQALPARSSASSRRHGAARSSARTGPPGHLTLAASGGYSPAPVATARVALPRPRPWPPPQAGQSNPGAGLEAGEGRSGSARGWASGLGTGNIPPMPG